MPPMLNMKRREFIALVGGGGLLLTAKVRRVRAQQPAMPVVGFLSSSVPADRARYLTAFRQGVRETGYVETVIAAHDTPSAIVAKAATTTIPIVFASGGDPVKLGLVASLNRPGGNVTGVSFVNAALGAKQLGLLHELQPGAMRVGVLVDPNYPLTESFVSDVQAAASSIRKQIEVLEAPTGRDIDTVLRALHKSQLMRSW